MAGPRILVVRLSSMGDIVHALPAVASLKHSFPGSRLAWVVNPRWAPLLKGNPFVDQVILLERRSLHSLRQAWRQLRVERFDMAIDFQGLVQSALVSSAARPDRIYGFHQSQVREKFAALFYSNKVRAGTAHVVDRNLELVSAAGASSILQTFPLPEGEPEGELPEGGFVLASPFAGWGAKQWPLENYREVARRLETEFGIPLVLNVSPEGASRLEAAGKIRRHVSGLNGLIYALRRARAVLGVDNGPLHIAAALGKCGVAIYGPTDPARNGPYGGRIQILRGPEARTSYKRRPEPDRSMRAISPERVFEALKACLGAAKPAGQFS